MTLLIVFRAVTLWRARHVEDAEKQYEYFAGTVHNLMIDIEGSKQPHKAWQPGNDLCEIFISQGEEKDQSLLCKGQACLRRSANCGYP